MGARPRAVCERDGYGVYRVEDVDALWRLYRRAVRENAELETRLDRSRRAAAYEERDFGWMGD